MFKNKNAQTGETISWLVATIIIFVIMMFFVFGASLLGSTKKVLQHKDTLFESSIDLSYSSAFQKSVYTYTLINDPTLKPRIRDYVINQSYNFDKYSEELGRLLKK